jgi:hypothetical protein
MLSAPLRPCRENVGQGAGAAGAWCVSDGRTLSLKLGRPAPDPLAAPGPPATARESRDRSHEATSSASQFKAGRFVDERRAVLILGVRRQSISWLTGDLTRLNRRWGRRGLTWTTKRTHPRFLGQGHQPHSVHTCFALPTPLPKESAPAIENRLGGRLHRGALTIFEGGGWAH